MAWAEAALVAAVVGRERALRPRPNAGTGEAIWSIEGNLQSLFSLENPRAQKTAKHDKANPRTPKLRWVRKASPTRPPIASSVPVVRAMSHGMLCRTTPPCWIAPPSWELTAQGAYGLVRSWELMSPRMHAYLCRSPHFSVLLCISPSGHSQQATAGQGPWALSVLLRLASGGKPRRGKDRGPTSPLAQ